MILIYFQWFSYNSFYFYLCVWWGFRIQLFAVGFQMMCCRNSIFWCHHVRDNNSQRHGVFLTLIGIRELNHQYSTVISEKGLRNSVIGDFIRAWVTIFLSFLTRFPNFVTWLDGDVNANVCSVFPHSLISTHRALLARTPPPRCQVTNMQATYTHVHTNTDHIKHM